MAIITISRGTFSGGKLLAEDVAAKLGYTCLSREIIIEAAEKYGVLEHNLFEAIQKGPSILQRFTFERQKYLTFIQAVLCEHARANNIVYHGHAGHFFLMDISHVLRVCVIAPMSYRIKAVMERQKLSEKEAVKYIRDIDKQRRRWTAFLYDKEWLSPELYDMVLNLESLAISFYSDLIQYAVKHERFQITSQSQKTMDDLALKSKVKAVIASHPDTDYIFPEVTADAGVLTISGKVKSEQTLGKILELAHSIPEVREIKNNLRLDYRYQDIDP